MCWGKQWHAGMLCRHGTGQLGFGLIDGSCEVGLSQACELCALAYVLCDVMRTLGAIAGGSSGTVWWSPAFCAGMSVLSTLLWCWQQHMMRCCASMPEKRCVLHRVRNLRRTHLLGPSSPCFSS